MVKLQPPFQTKNVRLKNDPLWLNSRVINHACTHLSLGYPLVPYQTVPRLFSGQSRGDHVESPIHQCNQQHSSRRFLRKITSYHLFHCLIPLYTGLISGLARKCQIAGRYLILWPCARHEETANRSAMRTFLCTYHLYCL